MTKTKTAKASAKARKKNSSSSPNDPATLNALQEVRQAQVAKYKTVKNTESAYSGYLTRARKFLAGIIQGRQADGEGEVCKAGIRTDELAQALDGDKPPNRYSAYALELFLIQKCFVDKRGPSTAEGIHGAFCEMWDKMDGGRYAGRYELNEATGEVRGCPARASNVTELVKCVKLRAKSEGASATRNHADAMTLEEIQTLMRWSLSVCPDERLTEDPREIRDVSELLFRLEHAFMRSFMSSAFTLWTRCFELLTLQAQDVQEGCQGPAPYFIPHFKVHLNHRKGWQQEKGYDGPRTSNIYDIYQQEIPEIDMYTHFNRWRDLLERYLGAKLTGEECFYPHISINGTIRTTRPMSYDSLQALLTRFCAEAGIEKRYTTHSFRRGGAQYRFMFAPLGKRWSLNQIRWWGGWAIGEHVDTLIKYLVDSLQSFENGFGHSLHPIPMQPNMSFMGDHVATAAITAEEFRQFGNHVNRKIDDLRTLVTDTSRLAISPAQSGTSSPSDQDACGAASPNTYVQPFKAANAVPPQPTITYQCGQTAGVGHLQVTRFLEVCQVGGRAVQGAAQPQKPKAVPQLPKVTVPPLGNEPGAWLRAVKQWEEVDPVTGIALKDWPREWYTGDQRTLVGSSRSQRAVIHKEFERLGRDASAFRALYPNADRSMKQLLTDIRRNSGTTRQGKGQRFSQVSEY